MDPAMEMICQTLRKMSQSPTMSKSWSLSRRVTELFLHFHAAAACPASHAVSHPQGPKSSRCRTLRAGLDANGRGRTSEMKGDSFSCQKANTSFDVLSLGPTWTGCGGPEDDEPACYRRACIGEKVPPFRSVGRYGNHLEWVPSVIHSL